MQDQGACVKEKERPINNSFSSLQHINILRMLRGSTWDSTILIDSVDFTSSNKKYPQNKRYRSYREY